LQFAFNNYFPFSNLPPVKASFNSKSKSPKQKPQSKSLLSSFSETFISSGKQGGAAGLRERCDIVTGETCVPASLIVVNNLGEAAVPHFPLLWPGLYQSQPADKHLRKSN
jgi:hypothetical protein